MHEYHDASMHTDASIQRMPFHFVYRFHVLYNVLFLFALDVVVAESKIEVG